MGFVMAQLKIQNKPTILIGINLAEVQLELLFMFFNISKELVKVNLSILVRVMFQKFLENRVQTRALNKKTQRKKNIFLLYPHFQPPSPKLF